MPQTRILRVPRTDHNEHLLLHVTQASATRPLDLKLIATDQEHLYHGLLKGSQIRSLKSEHFSGDEDELRDVLLFSLMQERPDGVAESTFEGLEIVSAIQKETVTLTLRKNIGGITQRVATVTLAEDDDKEEVGAFEWVHEAVEVSDGLRTELAAVQSTIATQKAEIDKLKARLEDFIQTKKEHDEDLMIKFAALLNTKKQKIRDLTNGVSMKGDPDAMDEDRPRKISKRKVEQDEDMPDVQEHDETPEQTEDEASADEEPDHDETSAVKTEQKSQTLSVDNLPEPIELSFARKQKPAPPPVQDDDDETDDEL